MGRRRHADWGQESRRTRIVMNEVEWDEFDKYAPFPGSELGHRVRWALYRYLGQLRAERNELDRKLEAAAAADIAARV